MPEGYEFIGQYWDEETGGPRKVMLTESDLESALTQLREVHRENLISVSFASETQFSNSRKHAAEVA